MVKITNFVNTFEVTQGAYDDIFKKQGFTLVEEKKETVKEKAEKAEELTDEEYVERLIEKPLSQWNKKEVKTYASINNIDISKTQNIGEARDIIKKSMDEEYDEE